jgi:hypothetical protein
LHDSQQRMAGSTYVLDLAILMQEQASENCALQGFKAALRTQADRNDERGAPVDGDEPRVPPRIGRRPPAQLPQLGPERRPVLPR